MNELVLQILVYGGGPLLILILTYFSGFRNAKKAAEIDTLRAGQEQDQAIRKIETQNQILQGKKEEANETISKLNSLDGFVSLWSKFNKKTPGDDAK